MISNIKALVRSLRILYQFPMLMKLVEKDFANNNKRIMVSSESEMISML